MSAQPLPTQLALLVALSLLTACAQQPLSEPSDPLESVNRAMFTFNRKADHYVLKPVAKGYAAVTPAFAQRGVSNFFSNLDEPRSIVNDMLQLKLVQAASDTGRFLLNSSAGFAGLMDVATDAGLPKHKEDFGLTLGHLGVGEGWYLMLPFLGPSNNRDLVGRVVDSPLKVDYYLSLQDEVLLKGADAIDARTRYFGADSLIDNAFDPYVFVRDAYRQRRLNMIYDGAPPRRLIYSEEP